MPVALQGCCARHLPEYLFCASPAILSCHAQHDVPALTSVANPNMRIARTISQVIGYSCSCLLLQLDLLRRWTRSVDCFWRLLPTLLYANPLSPLIYYPPTHSAMQALAHKVQSANGQQADTLLASLDLSLTAQDVATLRMGVEVNKAVVNACMALLQVLHLLHTPVVLKQPLSCISSLQNLQLGHDREAVRLQCLLKSPVSCCFVHLVQERNNVLRRNDSYKRCNFFPAECMDGLLW